MDLRQIKTGPEDFGLMTYDPAFMNTASCKSAITYIDGDKGILRYRGYPIEVLAEQCTFLEVAYLLLFGELPTEEELEAVGLRHHAPHHAARDHQEIHGRIPLRSRIPWSMFVSTVAALSSVYPDARSVHDPENRHAPDRAADRQSAVHRGHVVPAQRRISRTSIPTTI